jgi:hypothetical protein
VGKHKPKNKQKKLDENELKRHLSKGTKIGIIIGILGLAISIAGLYYAMNPPIDQISKLLDEKIGLIEIGQNKKDYPAGEYGNRFTSLIGGFTVEKPNEKWDLISDVPKLREKQGRTTTQTFVDGVELSRPDFASIVVSVQKPISEADHNITIDQWFKLAIATRIASQDSSFNVLEEYISPEDDYGFIKMVEKFPNDNVFYHYETIRFYNGMVYSFHINSNIPDQLPQEVVNEIDFIFNSYKIIT